MRRLIAVVACLMVSACSGTVTRPEPTHLHPHYEGSLFKITDKKLYSVEILLKDAPFHVGANTMDIIVHKDVEGNRDVENAVLQVTPWMPLMGHGVRQEPVITERGAGLYTAENVVAIMDGYWELRVDIQGDVGRDTVVFEFPDVRRPEGEMHGGAHDAMEHYGMSKPPPGTDLSTSRSSATGRMKASYESTVGFVPLNRIHRWHLTLSGTGGEPVSGAAITVSGDMVEHGHGLPTKPEVTKEIQKGVYQVDGMKFNMPGWWTITFEIEAGDLKDQVTFNLDVE